MQAKMLEKKFLQAETEEKKFPTEGNLTFKVKCQGIIIKNSINCCYDSKSPLECPQIEFLRFYLITSCNKVGVYLLHEIFAIISRISRFKKKSRNLSDAKNKCRKNNMRRKIS